MGPYPLGLAITRACGLSMGLLDELMHEIVRGKARDLIPLNTFYQFLFSAYKTLHF